MWDVSRGAVPETEFAHAGTAQQLSPLKSRFNPREEAALTETFDDRSRRHAEADAHRLQTVAPAGAFEDVHQFGH